MRKETQANSRGRGAGSRGGRTAALTERGCVRGEGAPAAALPKAAACCGWSSTQPRSGAGSWNRRTAALTLIELLAVIAIIAILGAILHPSFRRHPGMDPLPRVLAASNEVGTARPQTTTDF